MKQRIRQCFNRGAKTYHLADTLQSRVAAYLDDYLIQISAKNILEIGCGTGLFSQKLLARFPNASMLLTDIAPVMLKVCQDRFPAHSQVKFACMDGEALNISSSFDLIASNMTLHWFTEINSSFSRILNQLTSGGKFIFAMVGSNSLCEWKDICNQYHLPIPTPFFPSHLALQENFPEIKLETRIIKHAYQSVFDFLNSLKKIGAIATNQHYIPMKISELRRILRKYDQVIDISYEIIYGSYTKP